MNVNILLIFFLISKVHFYFFLLLIKENPFIFRVRLPNSLFGGANSAFSEIASLYSLIDSFCAIFSIGFEISEISLFISCKGLRILETKTVSCEEAVREVLWWTLIAVFTFFSIITCCSLSFFIFWRSLKSFLLCWIYF